MIPALRESLPFLFPSFPSSFLPPSICPSSSLISFLFFSLSAGTASLLVVSLFAWTFLILYPQTSCNFLNKRDYGNTARTYTILLTSGWKFLKNFNLILFNRQTTTSVKIQTQRFPQSEHINSVVWGLWSKRHRSSTLFRSFQLELESPFSSQRNARCILL